MYHIVFLDAHQSSNTLRERKARKNLPTEWTKELVTFMQSHGFWTQEDQLKQSKARARNKMSAFLYRQQGWLNLEAIKQEFKDRFPSLTALSAQFRTGSDHMTIRSPSPEEVTKIKALVFQAWNRTLAEDCED